MIGLPAPSINYSRSDEAERNRQLELADSKNLKRDVDIELLRAGLYLHSPDGSRWRLKVSNTGVLGCDPA